MQIHHFIIKTMKGLKGYNQVNLGYLYSALEQIKLDKLTHLMFSCITFHPFNENDKKIDNFAQYMEDKVVKVADNSLSKDDLKRALSGFLSKDAL